MPKRHLLVVVSVTFGSISGARAADTMPVIPVHGNTPGHICNADRSRRFIGRAGTRATGESIRQATRAAVLRWAPPDAMLTMDYRPDRVTVYLDARKQITRISCG